MNRRILPVAIVIPLAFCFQAAIADLHVWVTPNTRRTLREDPRPNDASNTATVWAARNECRSFQILVRSDAPARTINIDPADLFGPDGAALRAADARLFRQHQLHITAGTYRNTDFKPGWYPDALIPFSHPITQKPLPPARFTAVPFDLPANETHGFWVDLAVPADARPGRYTGQYRITSDGNKLAKVSVVLTVWDFALPRISTLQTAFGSPAGRMRSYYRKLATAGKEPEPADWPAVETQCAQLLTEHRINATPPSATLTPVAQPDGSFRIPADQVAALRQFVDIIQVNAIQVPHPNNAVKDPDAERAKLHAWLAAFDRAAAELNRSHITFYTYLLDEPNDEKAYRYVQKWGKAIRQANSVVKVMVVEQTRTQDPAWGDLYGAVDIWCPLFCLFDPDDAARRQALGETLWTYTALCQGKEKTPWWHTDYPLLNYRAPAWMAWRYRMRGLLYWGGLSYWDQVADPWIEPNTYRPKGEGNLAFNGEGCIVYPARPVGYDGIAPSLRLKALRDSIQDYEYLAILERLGLAKEADQIVLDLTPSFYRWNPDPAAYDSARAQLAALILTAGRR